MSIYDERMINPLSKGFVATILIFLLQQNVLAYDYIISLQNGSEEINNIPIFVQLPLNVSGISFYDNNSLLLPYEVDSVTNMTNFWVLVNLQEDNDTIIYANNNDSFIEEPLKVWYDYKSVYHFSEIEGNFSKDSAQDNNTIYGYDSINNYSTSLNFTFNNSAFGNALRFNGGLECGISIKNTTLDISDNNDRSIFFYQQILGSFEKYNHGQVFTLGNALPKKILGIRYDEIHDSWMVDNHNISNNLGISNADYGLDFGYLEIKDGKEKVYWGNNNYVESLVEQDTDIAPLQIGGAWGINIGFNGCTASFNGTIDEFRLSNKTFADSYVIRTRMMMNNKVQNYVPNKKNISLIEEVIIDKNSQNNNYGSSGGGFIFNKTITHNNDTIIIFVKNNMTNITKINNPINTTNTTNTTNTINTTNTTNKDKIILYLMNKIVVLFINQNVYKGRSFIINE